MIRELLDYVNDILDAVIEIEDFTKDMDFNEFAKDKKTTNAVIRSLEIIGEAAKKIPETVRKRYPNIPWKRMAGMRDKLIHEYHGIDLEIVWIVIKEELPPIRPIIKKLLRDMEQEDKE